MRELLHLPYSSWSEKARWVLDVPRVPYAARRYRPLLGELSPRRMLGRVRGPSSVRVPIDEKTAFGDSFEKARA
jgi:hypothetical protein